MHKVLVIYAALVFCFTSAENDIPSAIDSRDAVLGMIRLQSGMRYMFKF